VGHALRSSGLLRLEASLTRVSKFVSKLVETRRRVVHMASSRRLYQSQVEYGWVDATGCIRPFYPTFVVFIVLGTRGSLVF
jgi:hypothetical protein